MNQRVSRHWRPWFLGLIATFGVACSSDTTNMDGTMVPNPPPTDLLPKVVFSEIMYHPVNENDYVDNHEFLELYNRTDAAVDISGWQLSGTVQFTFPSGTTIAPRSYAVLAKNKAALSAISSYMISAANMMPVEKLEKLPVAE